MIVNELLSRSFIDGRILRKFTNIMPPDIDPYIFVKANQFILYIAKNKVDFNKIDSIILNENLVGYIEFVIIEEEGSATVSYISVSDTYQGLGISKFLFIIMSEVLNKIGIEKIELDDDSDRAWQSNNLYLQLGFKYINDEPEPEMIGNSIIISSLWNRDYFLSKGFFILE
jgi:N-acetylglutamate synthase-like GNAT family acetyltransferase